MYPRISDLTQDLFGFTLPFPIYGFGLMVAVAVVLGTVLTQHEVNRKYALGLFRPVSYKDRDKKGKVKVVKGSPAALIWVIMAVSISAGVVGAKLFHIIDYWDRFTQAPLELLFSGAGLTFYGGLIFGVGTLIWYIRRKGIAVAPFMDSLAPGVMLGYGVGRIGCYLAGDGDWGKCSVMADKPGFLPGWLWSETFPNNILNRDLVAECAAFGPQYTGVYPTMLYEFAACALLAGLLWAVRKHPFRAGWLFSLYLVLAAVERYAIEIIRVNPDRLGGLSQAQIISIGLFVIGLAAMAYLMRKKPEPTVPNTESEPVPKQPEAA